MVKEPAVYIVAKERNGTLYTGVTSDLRKRASEHRSVTGPGFSARYGCKFLVWFELHGSMETAIMREKQIKGGSSIAKLRLIERANPDWRDLHPTIL